MKYPPASDTAIALFGSCARNDCDSLSDRDVLILNDDNAGRLAAVARLRNCGWSPVAYSWRRLNTMADSKRLFIQHLKQESLILSDPLNRLQDLLRSFRPAAGYGNDIDSAKEFLGLLAAVPASVAGCYWALDVLMVGLRALAIVQLANEGIYSFSFGTILSDLVRVGTLKRNDVQTLMRLRKFKRDYRSGRIAEGVNYKVVSGLISLVDRRFKIGLQTRQVDPSTLLELASADHDPRDWYSTCRRIEAALFGFQPRSRRSADEIESFKAEMRRITTSPSEYGWKVKRDARVFARRLRRLSDDAELYFPNQISALAVRTKIIKLCG